ncbi:transglutaminase TgpA family protein [Paenibacillus eucommiae]|uniref:Transglutaminase-like putative cysteine protease n=1 Tax=Paenibacillus eucommiae TaxID=1355755 RepID=A0ABS4J0Q0_9BACL|nr:transglutaminase domain-containing protein [Paenibacillus eucommiae]MBP1992905.1 transglutaminase-like putative cysteine protease [Paenibacillus eucommiae]
MPIENKPWKGWLNSGWSSRLTALLVGVFLLQYVSWIVKEEVIWLIETVRLVKWTLFWVGLTFFIPRLHWTYRSILQFILVVIVQMRLFGLHFNGLQFRTLAGFKQSVAANYLQFEPFIWFSLSAWLVYLGAIWMAQTKSRIYLMILMSVLFFAIRDSFSMLSLWPQVSMILFCGFSLLIVRHFSELKNRAPKSWEKLAKYPTSIGIPIILLIAATILVGALVPSMNPVLTDPYTAWKVSRGESVNMAGKGSSVTFPSSSNTSSGYSRDDRELGGSFRFDYTPVMTVDSDSRTYFRGETRSFYNESGWEPSATEKRLPLSSVEDGNLPADPRFNLSELKTKEVKQTVVMNNEETYPVLFAGFSLQKILTVNEFTIGFDFLRWSPRQSELRFVAKKNYPRQYSVLSQQPVVDEEALRQTTANYSNQVEWEEYLQLPEDLPLRIQQLAMQLSQNADNPYDKVKELEQYLRQNFSYTNEPDVSKGVSKDFVDRFLFEIKEGYCDYFSTAMVVMARTIGIPARWVKGYSSGQIAMRPDVPGNGGLLSQDPDGPGVYTIRNSDAHSWVEVYFEGWGWIPFEPTAGFALPAAPVQQETAPVTPVPEDVPAATPVAAPVVEESSSSSFGLFTVLGAVLVLLLAGLFAAFKFGWLTGWRNKARRNQVTNFNQKMIIEFERLLRHGKRKGYLRQEHETIREAIARWSVQSNGMKSDLETVLKLFEKAKYSKAAASETDYMSLNETIHKLRTQMK